jgi:hypothetical protein
LQTGLRFGYVLDGPRATLSVAFSRSTALPLMSDSVAARMPLPSPYDRPLGERHFVWGLLGISLVLHALMAATLGAKYWYDTISYFQLAAAITDPAALRDLYAGEFGLAYQHIMPGLPLLIGAFEFLFGRAMWPAFAIVQYGLGAVACVYLATSFGSRIGRPGQLAIVVLSATFPFFSAFNGAILTESLSASIFLFLIGTTIRRLDKRIGFLKSLAIVLVLGVIGGQFRSYIAGVGAGSAFLLIFDRGRFREFWLYGFAALTAVGGVLAFPAYRAAIGMEFALPNVNAWMLMHTSYVAWDLDDRSQRALDGVVLDPVIREKLVVSHDPLVIGDVVKMVGDLVATGKSRTEAGRLIAAAAWTVRTQSPAVVGRQLQLSLSSLGFQYFATCCDPEREMRRGGYTGRKMLGLFRYYYAWNAGLDDDDYGRIFDRMITAYRAAPQLYSAAVIDWYMDRVGPYVRSQPSPLRYLTWPLGSVPTDALILAGIWGFVVLSRRDWRLLCLLGLSMAPIYAAAVTASVVGDNRHSHPLWPLYFAGIAALAEWIVPRIRDRPRNDVST